MIWSAKQKLFPVSLDSRIVPWAICALVAAAMAVPGVKSAEPTDSQRIAQLEKRIHQLEQVNQGSNYSILPSPAEKLPALDSPAFYSKCEQWHVDPDRLKVLARKLADKQGIKLDGDKPRTEVARVVKPSESRGSWVAWRAPDQGQVRPELALFSAQSFSLAQYAGGAPIPAVALGAHRKHGHRRKHRRD